LEEPDPKLETPAIFGPMPAAHVFVIRGINGWWGKELNVLSNVPRPSVMNGALLIRRVEASLIPAEPGTSHKSIGCLDEGQVTMSSVALGRSGGLWHLGHLGGFSWGTWEPSRALAY
jgi:hypothetical protein